MISKTNPFGFVLRFHHWVSITRTMMMKFKSESKSKSGQKPGPASNGSMVFSTSKISHKDRKKASQELPKLSEPADFHCFDDSESFVEFISSEKNFSVSHFARKHRDKRDIDRKIASVALGLKKANERSRRKGRFKPEGDSYVPSQHMLPELYQVSSALLRDLRSADDAFYDSIATAFVRISSFLFACANSDDLRYVCLTTAGQYVSSNHICFIRTVFDNTVFPQGDDMVSKLSKLKNLTGRLSEMPCYQAIVNMLTIIVGAGIWETSSITDNMFFSGLLQSCDSNLRSQFSYCTLIDAIISIIEFTSEAKVAYSNGVSFSDFLMPDTISSEYTRLKKLEEDVHAGRYEDEGITLVKYLGMLETFHVRLKSNQYSTGSPRSQQYIAQYVHDVSAMMKKTQVLIRQQQVRPAPFCVLFFGAPGVGKTMVSHQFISAVGSAIGDPFKEEEMYTMCESDKFDSGLTARSRVYILDDAAAMRLDRISPENSTFSRLIRMCNTMPHQSNQADLANKGNVYYTPELFVLTSNVQHLDVPGQCNEPEAVYRRMIMVKVRVKPEFAAPDGKVDPLKLREATRRFGYQPPIHDMTPYRCEPKLNGVKIVEDIPMCVSDWLAQTIQQVKEHRKAQSDFITNFRQMRSGARCDRCHLPVSWCKCSDDVAPEGYEIVKHLFSSAFEGALMDFVSSLNGSLYRSFCPLIEQSLVKLFLFISVHFIKNYKFFFKFTWPKFVTFLLFSASLVYSFSCFSHSYLISIFCILLIFAYMFCVGLRDFVAAVILHDIRTSAVLSSGRPKFFSGCVAFAGLLYVLKSCVSLLSSMKVKPEGNIAPTTMTEVEQRNAELNPWKKKPFYVKPSAEHELMTMSKDQVISSLSKNIFRFSFENSKIGLRGNIFAYDCTTFILSKHLFDKITKEDPFPVLKFTSDPGVYGSSFTRQVRKSIVLRDSSGSELDFVLFRVDSGPSVKCMKRFFTDSITASCGAFMLSRDLNGKILTRQMSYIRGMRCLPTVGSAFGSFHKVSPPTAAGDCMSPIVCGGNPHVILGFHCGGNGSGMSMSFDVSSQSIETALLQLNGDILSLLPEGSEEKASLWGKEFSVLTESEISTLTSDLPMPHSPIESLDLAPYGQPMYDLTEEADSRHPINFLGYYPGAHPLVYGGYDPHSRISPRSRVKITQMSPHLDALGVLRHVGPPEFRSNRDHGAYLEKYQQGMHNVDVRTLTLCVVDYCYDIRKHLKKVKYPETHSISFDVALNGIPNNRWYTQIDEHTSAGPGLPGKKVRYMDVSYNADDDGRKVLKCHSVIVEKTMSIMDGWSKGHMNSPVARVALKDEPTQIRSPGDRKANRVFSVFGFPFFMATKMLCAPLSAVVGQFPILFESALGINCTNNEWHDFATHLASGDANVPCHLMGDFSKFDVVLSGQVIRAVGVVLLHVASIIGYSRLELRMLSTLMSDLVSTNYMYNGALISVDGWNPSGNSLTVLINGIANSLIHRACYFEYLQILNSRTIPRFRSRVRLMTMGDDSIALSFETWFNMHSMADWCKRHGMTYTFGDNKGLVAKPFASSHELEFCKRQIRYSCALSKFLAPLSLKSIYKSLHCLMESDEDELEILAQNCCSALLELSRHPRSVFDSNRVIILEAANRTGIGHMIKNSEWSYDQWISHLKERYFSG